VFRHLLRTTVAIVALSALGATTVASASASTTAPRIYHSKHLTRTHKSKKPHQRPTHHPMQHTTSASGSVVYTENRLGSGGAVGRWCGFFDLCVRVRCFE
jgi:hypothetical protein